MNRLILFLFVFVCNGIVAQVSPELWLSGSIKRDLSDRVSSEASLDLRFYEFAAPGTLFPQLSVDYKVLDGIKLSVDYRMIFDENKFNNYQFTNRINLNSTFKYHFKHFDLKCRLRYQTAFGTLRRVGNYSPEFDEAFRIKPSIDILLGKKSKFDPFVSGEWFYSPENKVNGNRFTKVRFSAGTEINLPGSRSMEISYIFGKTINLPKFGSEHILSLSYSYDWKKLTPEEKAAKAKAKARKKALQNPAEEAEE
ncbi:MAG: DUF2490 domain-containing protein [Crocinitomicaceae bacterium]|nr:MAG: DUF2490 domain-containing protein [Crocinitomicaceae bacterium]